MPCVTVGVCFGSREACTEDMRVGHGGGGRPLSKLAARREVEMIGQPMDIGYAPFFLRSRSCACPPSSDAFVVCRLHRTRHSIALFVHARPLERHPGSPGSTPHANHAEWRATPGDVMPLLIFCAGSLS